MNDMQIPKAVQRIVDAINDGDTDAFVAAFASDGLVDDWGRILRGSTGVRQWAESDAVGAGAKMTVLETHIEAQITEIRFTWVSRVFTGESSAFVTVDGDKVTSFRIPPHA